MEPVSDESSGGSSSKHAEDSTPKPVKHNPRKRATPPGFGVIKEEAFDPEAGVPAGTNPRRPIELPAERTSEQALHAQAILDENRMGPHIVRYGESCTSLLVQHLQQMYQAKQTDQAKHTDHAKHTCRSCEADRHSKTFMTDEAVQVKHTGHAEQSYQATGSTNPDISICVNSYACLV